MSVLNKINIETALEESGNQLFPVFLKLNGLKVLLVGAGNVGVEKMTALLSNSPETQLTIVAERVLPAAVDIAGANPSVVINYRKFEEADLDGKDLVILATADNTLNAEIRQLARTRNLLINVADKPELCDFYLGSVVKKGDLKIGISTNGKSPTIAKRLKEVFQQSLPDELDITLQQMNRLRETLGGDFAHKVTELNKATAMLVGPAPEQGRDKRMHRILWVGGMVIAGLIVFLLLYSYPVRILFK